jgi:hypothetical protein
MIELDKRLRADLRKMGDFSRIHPLPGSSADVPDDLDARLVVLGITQAYSKEAGNAAEVAARTILENRGNTPRLYRNTLVFLAADKTRVQDLDEAVRKYLAWESILSEQETLDLSPHQVKQAETQQANADSIITARLPETYQWLLVPTQLTPQTPVTWQALRLSGQDALAVRASKKLRSDELLVVSLAPSSLKLELDNVPLWRGDHVAVRQLVEDFGRYHYLPRLRSVSVLLDAIQAGVNSLTWELDTFAYAEGYDEAVGRYRGLRSAALVTVSESDGTLIVRPDVAKRQLDAEVEARRRHEEEIDAARSSGTLPLTAGGHVGSAVSLPTSVDLPDHPFAHDGAAATPDGSWGHGRGAGAPHGLKVQEAGGRAQAAGRRRRTVTTRPAAPYAAHSAAPSPPRRTPGG